MLFVYWVMLLGFDDVNIWSTKTDSCLTCVQVLGQAPLQRWDRKWRKAVLVLKGPLLQRSWRFIRHIFLKCSRDEQVEG